MKELLRIQISNELRAKGEGGIVPLDLLEKTLHSKVLADHQMRKDNVTKRIILESVVDLVRQRRRKEALASANFFRKAVGRIFYAWSDWVYMVGVGLDRKRWSAARRYEVRYNQKKVDHFATIRLLRMVIKPWRGYTARAVKSGSLYRKHLSSFIYNIFILWRTISNKFRKLRIEAIDSWKNYSRLVLQSPFQLWAQYAAVSRKKSFESEHRGRLYCRWKHRKFLEKILRTWRHYALYGRVDGMYSRPVLIQSLREQKMQCSRMIKVMASQTIQIESMTQTLETEISRRMGLEKQLRMMEEDSKKAKLAAHHMQSELQRLETVIEVSSTSYF